ncbi:MAG: hypothetical protein HQ559_07815 [Lentisphaerae bacterium]|nr:hypothetical protein [Lentisphaerota bacterium]
MRQKLITIHGWGGTFGDAVAQIRELSDFPSRWAGGVFLVPKRIGGLLRRLLTEPEPNRYLQALQKAIVGRLLASCTALRPPEIPVDDAFQVDEASLLRDFAHFGIPITPDARERRARRLIEEAAHELAPVMPAIERLHALISDPDQPRPTEQAVRDIVAETSTGVTDHEAFTALLENVRDMHETGGDLDTVASAALYAHALTAQAAAAGNTLRYGPDYRYAFVNYHESLRDLADGGPAEVFMADMPIGALPDFEEDARFLRSRDVTILRFEDHHPFTDTQQAMLQGLSEEGVVGYVALSGPLDGREMDTNHAKCGADMVYESMVKGRPWDCPGARRIRATAHSEDFVSDRAELGALLTGLIKGGVCKIELAQVMVESMPGDDLPDRLRARGWDKLTQEWDDYFVGVQDRLSENCFLLRLTPPDTAERPRRGSAPGPSSDIPAACIGTVVHKQTVDVLMALAPVREPGQPRITVGKAIEFFTRAVPDADYVFYCYGSGMLVARRINQADLSLNLGSLMRRLGTDADGGHAGAAVARPEAHPDYPHRLLGRVTAANFGKFVRYMSFRLEDAGYGLSALENRSVASSRRFREGGKRLLMITAAAVLLGLLLVVLFPAFRPKAVRESNRTFVPQIGTVDDEADIEEGGAGDDDA